MYQLNLIKLIKYMAKQEYHLERHGDYVGPSVKVVEVNPFSLICNSDGTEQYEENIDPDIF